MAKDKPVKPAPIAPVANSAPESDPTITLTMPTRLVVVMTKNEDKKVVVDLSEIPDSIMLKIFQHGAHSALNDAHSSLTKTVKDSQGNKVPNPAYSDDACIAVMNKRIGDWQEGEWATRGPGTGTPTDPLADMIEKVAKEWCARDFGTTGTYRNAVTYKADKEQSDRLEERANRKGWKHASAAEKAECLKQLLASYKAWQLVKDESARRLAPAPELPD